jgi:death-on-curing protein
LSEPGRLFTAQDLIELNSEVLNYGGGRHGDVRYMNGLLYALDRPWLAFEVTHPIYPEPHDKAAALMEIIIRNHPFVDGNKRTAFVAGVTLLRMLSGRRVVASPEEVLAVCQSVESKEWGAEELAVWFRDNAC